MKRTNLVLQSVFVLQKSTFSHKIGRPLGPEQLVALAVSLV